MNQNVKKLAFSLAALILLFPIIGGCAEKKEYDLTIAAYGNGTTVPIPGTYTHDEGEAVTVTAIPDAGWALVHWSGDATGTAATVTITMDSAKEVSAKFAQIRKTLTVKVIPTRGGLVSLKPPQAWKGYVVGTEVTLTAVPHAGYEFDHWSGDATGIVATDTITMDRDKKVYAHFNQIGFRLTVEVTPIGGGAVTVEPSQPPEGYVAGTEVTLTAVASEGYEFDHWDVCGIAYFGSICGESRENPITITWGLEPGKAVTAFFSQ